MPSSFTFAPAVKRQREFPPLDFELLERSYALAEEGRFLASVTKVLEHLFPEKRPVPDLTAAPFSFVQGSSRVTVRLEGEGDAVELAISVPLVQLPTGGATVAALRYLLTRISGSGQLHQPRLRGEAVTLEFRDLVARLHPTKLLEALRRMPLEADSADDWLIGQFSALPLERAEIAALSAEELERAMLIWRAHWDEVEELLKESQRKRSMFFLNELTAYSLYRLRYSLPMSGFVAAKLNEAAATFNDSEIDPLKREASLAKCAKEMKALSAEALTKSLGHAEYAISPLQEGKDEILTTYFKTGDYIKTIDKLRTTGKSLDAALALASTYSYLLGRFSWPAQMAKELEAGLLKISGLPWREAAGTLYAYSLELIKRYKSDDDDDDDGGGDHGKAGGGDGGKAGSGDGGDGGDGGNRDVADGEPGEASASDAGSVSDAGGISVAGGISDEQAGDR